MCWLNIFFLNGKILLTSKKLGNYKGEYIRGFCIQLFQEMVDILFLEEYHLNEFSTIESNKKLLFGGAAPKMKSLRNFHRDHKDTPQIASMMSFFEEFTCILPIQVNKSLIWYWWGTSKSNQAKTFCQIASAREQDHKVWIVVSTVESQMGQERVSSSIPFLLMFHLEGKRSRRALQIKMFIFFGRNRFHIVPLPSSWKRLLSICSRVPLTEKVGDPRDQIQESSSSVMVMLFKEEEKTLSCWSREPLKIGRDQLKTQPFKL